MLELGETKQRCKIPHSGIKGSNEPNLSKKYFKKQEKKKDQNSNSEMRQKVST